MLSEAKHLDLFSSENQMNTDQKFFASLRMTCQMGKGMFSRDPRVTAKLIWA